MKVQCWGPVWSEKVGWCCCITSRSGWLLELLTELTKNRLLLKLQLSLKSCNQMMKQLERKIWKQPNNYHPILVCSWWWSLTSPSGVVIVESMSQGLCLGDSQRRVDSGNYTFMFCIFDLISLTIQFDRLCLWVLDISGKATELFPLEGGSQRLWRKLWRGSDLAGGLSICWWDFGLDFCSNLNK